MTRLGEAPGDLANVSPEKVARRRAFIIAFCAAKGWPTDPAKLDYHQFLDLMLAIEEHERRGTPRT